jgi:YjbE family integral membrane protein
MISSYQELLALAQVVVIDVALAGDNAIVIGLAASQVAPSSRRRVIFWGTAGAVIVRVLFAAVAAELLAIIGLTLAGGILLLWVCWKMFREFRQTRHDTTAEPADVEGRAHLRRAVLRVVAADVSMSLDNVLAVAGAAREHPVVLIFGLLLSIALMGAAASFIARLLQSHRWIAYVGLIVILYVAVEMTVRGTLDIMKVASA